MTQVDLVLVETPADDLDGEILHYFSVNPGTPPGRLAGALGSSQGETRGAVERLAQARSRGNLRGLDGGEKRKPIRQRLSVSVE